MLSDRPIHSSDYSTSRTRKFREGNYVDRIRMANVGLRDTSFLICL